MDVLPLLRTAGGLPLAQLQMRASGSAGDVLGELNILVKEGLVAIDGDMPRSTEQLRSSDAVASLTVKGTRRVFR